MVVLYIIKDIDCYRLGRPPVVRLWEPKSLRRTWIRKVTVELPEGFYVADSENCVPCEPLIYRNHEPYQLATDENEDPIIIDHTNNHEFIHLTILNEGWD